MTTATNLPSSGVKPNTYVRFIIQPSTAIEGMKYMLSGETKETFLGRPRSVYFGHSTDKQAAQSAKLQAERKHIGKSAD